MCLHVLRIIGVFPYAVVITPLVNGCVSLCAAADLLCPVLPDPLNGEVNVSSRIISSIASYTCNDGFTLVGEEERECMADGQWSGREPICVCEFEQDVLSLCLC